MEMSRPSGRRPSLSGPSWRRLPAILALALILAFVAFCTVWRIGGGSWQRVESPSMGTRAPVGSLLWTRPTDFDSLQSGDFITFHPPGRPSATYSHLIQRRLADGTLTTRGMISGSDPWRLTHRDLVGKVRMTWPGVGWIVVAAPILIAGTVIIGLVSSLAGRRWRLPAIIVLAAITLTVAIMVYKPLLDAEQIAARPNPAGGADGIYVGTGLLPIRIQAAGDHSHLDLRTGEIGTVHVPKPDQDNRFRVRLSAAVPFWFWIAMIFACFLPAIYTATIGLPRPKAEDPSGT